MPEYEIKSAVKLQEAIIRVIAFFDLFDHPLTAYEIWGQLGRTWSLAEILDFFDQNMASPAPIFGQKNGFYFLAGRDDIITVRQKRHNYGARKIKIARRFAHVFSLLPFLKMVALANTIGQHNLRDDSDIDFFIISSPRRIWLTRLYCTGLAKILNRRPTAADKKDKICLSFYISCDRLNLDDLRLPGDDPYFDYWRRSLVLLYNKDNVYERYLETNGLVAEREISAEKSVLKSNFILDKLEGLAKIFQLAIMPAALKDKNNNSDGVVINDSILKLYQRDNRREYAEKYGNKVNEILKKNN